MRFDQTALQRTAASLEPPPAKRVLRPMSEEDEKSLKTLLEEAARARRHAIALFGDPAARELERYAEELEAEIRRRATATDAPTG